MTEADFSNYEYRISQALRRKELELLLHSSSSQPASGGSETTLERKIRQQQSKATSSPRPQQAPRLASSHIASEATRKDAINFLTSKGNGVSSPIDDTCVGTLRITTSPPSVFESPSGSISSIPTRSTSADINDPRVIRFNQISSNSPIVPILPPTKTSSPTHRTPRPVRPPKALPQIPAPLASPLSATNSPTVDFPTRSTSRNALTKPASFGITQQPVAPPRKISQRSEQHQTGRRALVWSCDCKSELKDDPTLHGLDSKAKHNNPLFLFSDLLVISTHITPSSYQIQRIIPLTNLDLHATSTSSSLEFTTWSDTNEGVFERCIYECIDKDKLSNYIVLLKEVAAGDEGVFDYDEICELVARKVFRREELEQWCKDL